MSDAVVAAIVAGVVSLFVTFGKVIWDADQKKRERRLAAREKLDMYREPLLSAVDDLGSRINNIRNDGFLFYLRARGRERTALLGTLFRFAQFFGWTEILYGSFDRLRFERDKSTKAVADVLRNVGRTLSVDRLDRANPSDFTTTQLMIWREEQRAIGEVMRASDDPPRCMSFDSFVRKYDSHFSAWFETFAAQLDPVSTPCSDRFAELQRLLANLIQELDVDRILVQTDPDGIVTQPRWARPSMLRRTAEADMIWRRSAGGA
jgi:hypothetical protein